jgi:hypothetical protein
MLRRGFSHPAGAALAGTRPRTGLDAGSPGAAPAPPRAAAGAARARAPLLPLVDTPQRLKLHCPGRTAPATDLFLSSGGRFVCLLALTARSARPPPHASRGARGFRLDPPPSLASPTPPLAPGHAPSRRRAGARAPRGAPPSERARARVPRLVACAARPAREEPTSPQTTSHQPGLYWTPLHPCRERIVAIHARLLILVSFAPCARAGGWHEQGQEILLNPIKMWK